MYRSIIQWVLSQECLRRKDLSQHCVLKALLTNLYALGNYLQLKFCYYLVSGIMPL